MIVCASNFVGYKIIEFLINSNEKIDFLVLDENDREEFNEKIISLDHTKYQDKPIYFNDDLNDEIFIDLLKNSKLELGILAWWPSILKGKILSIPSQGWLSFHPAYLPYNRGKHPNFWCLVDETKCGVSLHFIDEGIGTGEIVAREEIQLSWDDIGKTVYEKSLNSIIELFIKSFKDIKENRLNRILQK